MRTYNNEENVKIHLGSYENIADDYDKIVDTKPFHTHYERPNCIKHLPLKLNNLRVLDLGCGTGWYAEQILARKGQLIALDCSEKMVNKTKARLQNQGQIVVHDLNLPLNFVEEQSIDYIIAPLVIHYIQDWERMFKDLSQKLKKNGNLIFSTHQPQLEIEIFKLQNYFLTQAVKDYWEAIGEVEYYHHSLHNLFSAIRNAGLNIDCIEEPQPLPDLQQMDPKLYDMLTTKPCLLFGVVSK